MVNKTATKDWIVRLQHAGVALLMATIVLMVLGELPLLLAPDTGQVRHVVSAIVAHTFFIAIPGLLLIVPSVIQRIMHLRESASRIGWAAAIRAMNKTPVYKPWPQHSDPAARRVSWGGLYPKDDVTYRATCIKLKGNHQAVQCPLFSRIVVTSLMLLLSAAVLLFPAAIDSLVYEVPPAHIVALKKFTQDAAFLFYGAGLIIGLPSILNASRSCITATFDKATNQCVIYQGRWFSRFLRRQTHSINTSQIRGIQIIGYRADQARRNKRLIQQYEMNLVDSNSKRIHLGKHPHQTAMLKDAKRLASLLNIKVWDRSERYSPSVLVEPDPIVQSL